MIVRSIDASQASAYDAVVGHPMQSFAWGEFRKTTGVSVERIGIFQSEKIEAAFSITFHSIPHTQYTIGYVAKGSIPQKHHLDLIENIAKKHNAIAVKIEPAAYEYVGQPKKYDAQIQQLIEYGCRETKPQFSRYTYIVDLQKSEEELLASFHQKTRYNINLAKKKGVQIIEDTTLEGVREYAALLKETTKRQQFYAHDETYYEKMFLSLQKTGIVHILKAQYEGKTLGIWILFAFNGTLYYPYGASSREHREVMANNLLAFQAIQLGKQLGCSSFDLWGCLGPDPDPKDPWYGFHKFKEGYAGTLVQTLGAYDLVLSPRLYALFARADRLRWTFLRLKAKLFSK